MDTIKNHPTKLAKQFQGHKNRLGHEHIEMQCKGWVGKYGNKVQGWDRVGEENIGIQCKGWVRKCFSVVKGWEMKLRRKIFKCGVRLGKENISV